MTTPTKLRLVRSLKGAEIVASDVKWIKITTDIFDDEKILLIESLPDAYAIIVVWFKLLCLAGKQNNSGVFMMGKIAYTDKMLATIFRMKEATVTMALQTFEQFGMVEIIDGVITIPNWGKHQNLEQLEQRRLYQREYQKEYRQRQKLLAAAEDDESKCLRKHLREPNVNSPEEDIEIDKEIDRDKEVLPKGNTKKKPEKRRYGEYQHVLLTDNEYENIANSFGIPMRDKAIRFLDEYIEEKGYKSKSHNLAIRRWVIQAVQEQEAKEAKQLGYGRKEAVPYWVEEQEKEDAQKEQERLKAYLAKLKGDTAGNNPEIAARAEALKEKLR